MRSHFARSRLRVGRHFSMGYHAVAIVGLSLALSASCRMRYEQLEGSLAATFGGGVDGGGGVGAVAGGPFDEAGGWQSGGHGGAQPNVAGTPASGGSGQGSSAGAFPVGGNSGGVATSLGGNVTGAGTAGSSIGGLANGGANGAGAFSGGNVGLFGGAGFQGGQTSSSSIGGRVSSGGTSVTISGGVGGGGAANASGGASGTGTVSPSCLGVGGRYVECPNPVTFAEATATCQSMGLRMIRIDSTSENAWYASLVSDGWLGASDLATEGEWSWSDGQLFWRGDKNGSPQGGLFNAWSGNDPSGNPATADCARLDSSGKVWVDVFCDDTQPFACEAN